MAAKLNNLDLSVMSRVGLSDAAVGVKRVRAALDAFEARMMTAMDGLGDGGTGSTELVRAIGGCSQREARRRARRAEALAQMPSVASALGEGDITAEHADALVKAAEATSAEAVDSDRRLLAEAKSLPADLAARAAGDWTHRHQRAQDREAELRRQRAMRSHRMWVDDNGMFNSHARLDPVTGARVRAILTDMTNRLYDADGGGDRARTRQHCHADAFTTAVGAEPGRPRPGSKKPDGLEPAVTDRTGAADPPPVASTPICRCQGRLGSSPRNQILVIAETGTITGVDPNGRCEIAGTGPIPRSELERLACEADLFGVLFSRSGLPLWHGRKQRTVSAQQWRVLLARDRGCVLCGTNPSYCHAHHIVAWSPPARGPTNIDNLALVCSRHHHHIHQHDLTLTRHSDGHWTTTPSSTGRSPGINHGDRPHTGPLYRSPRLGA